MYQVVSPQTDEEFERYYHLRWKLIKEPWDLPVGSEKDEYESFAIHRMIVDGEGLPIAVARLHVTSVEEGQIRYMAVAKPHRGNGLGALLMMALEDEARKQGVKRVVLNSPEAVMEFYSKCGYRPTGDAPTLFGSISYQQMKKNLYESDVIIRDAKWCQELQQSWHEDIPISQVMGIRIHQYTGELFETKAALNPNLNLHGTMFAGSIYSLAVLTGWGLLHLWLKDENQPGKIVLGDGNIHYHKPVTSQPGAIARKADITGDLMPLKQGNKARIEINVEIRDEETAVAEFTGVYVVLPE